MRTKASNYREIVGTRGYSPRPRFRFSLRSLFLLVTILAISAALWRFVARGDGIVVFGLSLLCLFCLGTYYAFLGPWRDYKPRRQRPMRWPPREDPPATENDPP